MSVKVGKKALPWFFKKIIHSVRNKTIFAHNLTNFDFADDAYPFLCAVHKPEDIHINTDILEQTNIWK